jgi:hypothetical protein
MTLPKFSNSYIITARNQPSATSYDNIFPLLDGNLWFYSAPKMYDNEVSDYTPAASSASTTPPAAFSTNLAADLGLAIAAGCPQLTVLVHGLASLFTNVIQDNSILGSGLRQWADYAGLVISFDWPSYDGFDSDFHYSSLPYYFPPPKTSGNIRDNINGSVQAFANLLNMLKGIQSQNSKVQINFVCHSEGNYMMMLGMYELESQASFLNQVILAAADINSGALQSSGSAKDTGQGMAISKLADQVTIYYSVHDDVLPWSYRLRHHHNPSYPDRLGLQGPASYSTTSTPLADNAYGVDCSAVIDKDVIRKYIPQVPHNVDSHFAYFYIPQMLEDWAAVLNGTAPGSVPNRQPNTGAQDGRGYIMNLVKAPEGHLVRGAARAEA